MSRKRRPFLSLLIAFFAGALCMLLFLAPGKFHLKDLLDSRQRAGIVNFDQAARRVEQFGYWAQKKVLGDAVTDRSSEDKG